MSDKKIFIAFILNLMFSIFEFIGGVVTNSVAIMSDAIHDFGDAISIGISYILEKISKKKPNDNYTFGYVRYSIIGALITNVILIVGSSLVVIQAIKRFINPVNINYDGMIIFALVGIIINFMAVYFTKGGKSLNQKSVNLHMLEDVFGWGVVLVGAIVIKFTEINRIDSILSIVVSLFILIHAIKNILEIVDLFLEKTPSDIDLKVIKEKLLEFKDIKDIHHIHVWSIDGVNNFITMHIVYKTKKFNELKCNVKKELRKLGINHSTIEFEDIDYVCEDTECHMEHDSNTGHHHH